MMRFRRSSGPGRRTSLRRLLVVLAAAPALLLLVGQQTDVVARSKPVRGGGTTTTTSTSTSTTSTTTTSTTAVPSTTTVPALPSGLLSGERAGVVTRRGAQLYLDGLVWRPIGVNAPQAATLATVNTGCGAQIDLDALFASLPPHSAVRVMFGQDQAINRFTGARDWSPFDRVIAAAEASPTKPKLIVGLTNQGGVCDAGVWKDRAWYAGGYTTARNDYNDGLPRVSYWQFIHELVPRYASSPAIAIWEPVGEPEPSNCASGYTGTDCYSHSTCPPDGAAVMRSFFDTIGAEFKRMAPSQLIGTAVIGGDQCGWVREESTYVHQSPYVDVATYHDYGYDSTALPAPLQMRLAQAAQIGKPLISEETGISARDIAGCPSLATRATWMTAKLDAAMTNGAAGFLVWLVADTATSSCDMYIGPLDPVRSILRDYRV